MSEQYAKRIMIAAPRSGSGKTTVTCALLETLKRRGLDPVSFKCGPDYIDPLFHNKVLGIESRNLDTFFAGREGIKKILSGYEDRYTVIEGVMGIYDGMAASVTEGSCYEISAITKTPVILVADASGVGRTLISLLKGILIDDTCNLIKGIILNRISEGFYEDLKPDLEMEIAKMRSDVILLGYFPKNPDIRIESRHLGLKLPGETENLKKKIDAAASALEDHVDIDALLSLMTVGKVSDYIKQGSVIERSAQVVSYEKSAQVVSYEKGPVLAVALDEAFCFYYKDNLDLFERNGVNICYFSPIRDERLPEDTAGILLGGGYPENHLKELSSNGSMLESIRNAISSGIPSLAECGGFMYLHKTITDMEGNKYEMAGVCDGDCYYSGHLVRFGYMMISSVNSGREELLNCLIGMKGHEFHYYESTCNGQAAVASKPFKDRSWNCMVVKNNGIWGFPHFYYGSKPEFVQCFVSLMKKGRSYE
ncbi:MAG: cobyrinate a,c-diamide synthase [Lachnospiraceae bacterium]|nr:cobyrinate a,c-diamide synthase [Lachnospiraceae bacterium]